MSRSASALLLDLDDTLYDRDRALVAWAQRCARAQVGHELSREALAALRRIDHGGHRDRRAFAADARALGLTVDPEQFPFAIAGELTVDPTTVATLTRLADRYRLAIVTNGGPAQRIKLAALGLADLRCAIIVSGELGVAKPDRAIFDAALRACDAASHEAVFVGDHPYIDIAAAAALGMATAWRIHHGRTPPWPRELAAPRWTIAAIDELPELLHEAAA